MHGYRPTARAWTRVRQLTKAGCNKTFREVASGAETCRAQLRRALAALDADDVLVVTRLDRLARSTRYLLNTLAAACRLGTKRQAGHAAGWGAIPAAVMVRRGGHGRRGVAAEAGA
jgi:hypothetical protein